MPLTRSNPVSYLTEEMMDTFADVAKTALKARPSVSKAELNDHVLGLLTADERVTWRLVVDEACERAIRSMQPIRSVA